MKTERTQWLRTRRLTVEVDTPEEVSEAEGPCASDPDASLLVLDRGVEGSCFELSWEDRVNMAAALLGVVSYGGFGILGWDLT